MGISLLPHYFCREDLASGKLLQILNGWQTSEIPVSFVYPSQKYISSKLSAFIQNATEPIRKSL
jgi:DNA-binding transcriptional LysR family regulator